MIVLYGSYAKNTYIELDERCDFGVKTYYISDYDLLVVTRKRLGVREGTMATRVNTRFMEGKDPQFQTHPQFINESIAKLNDALSEGRYFYTEIISQGILLYDSGAQRLAEPRELNYAEVKKIAQQYFDKKYADANDYLWGAKQFYLAEKYDKAIFLLHQAAEYFIKSIPLVYALYGYKEHDLHFLCEKSKLYTAELASVFPCDNEEERRLFELLRSAYIEARYNDKFIVTKADIDALLTKVECLRDVVERVCKERFAYYDSRIKK